MATVTWANTNMSITLTYSGPILEYNNGALADLLARLALLDANAQLVSLDWHPAPAEPPLTYRFRFTTADGRIWNQLVDFIDVEPSVRVINNSRWSNTQGGLIRNVRQRLSDLRLYHQLTDVIAVFP